MDHMYNNHALPRGAPCWILTILWGRYYKQFTEKWSPQGASLESKGVGTVFPRQGRIFLWPLLLAWPACLSPQFTGASSTCPCFHRTKGTSWTEPPASGVLGCCTCCSPDLQSCLPWSPSPFCWLLPTFALRSSSSSTCTGSLLWSDVVCSRVPSVVPGRWSQVVITH